MRLKIISCNIWNGGRLMERLVAFLRREQPDVLALQEVYNGHDPTLEPRFRSLEALREASGLRHFAFAPELTEVFTDFTAPEGNAVLSRFPIMRHVHWFYDVPFNPRFVQETADHRQTPHNLQHVVLDLPGRNLHLFNTHGIWDTHGRDTPRREKMIDAILERMADARPAVLCGDFNVNEGTEAIARLNAAMVNIFAADRRTSSFNLDHKPPGTGYGAAVVDFIFTTPDVKVLDHRQPDDDVSDHRPLVAELEI